MGFCILGRCEFPRAGKEVVSGLAPGPHFPSGRSRPAGTFVQKGTGLLPARACKEPEGKAGDGEEARQPLSSVCGSVIVT